MTELKQWLQVLRAIEAIPIETLRSHAFGPAMSHTITGFVKAELDRREESPGESGVVAILEAVIECGTRYRLDTPWPVADELRLALIKDCPHTERFEFQGGAWQCERCGATG